MTELNKAYKNKSYKLKRILNENQELIDSQACYSRQPHIYRNNYNCGFPYYTIIFVPLSRKFDIKCEFLEKTRIKFSRFTIYFYNYL